MGEGVVDGDGELLKGFRMFRLVFAARGGEELEGVGVQAYLT